MKQSEYLSELKENLEGKIPSETLRDILSDYESFYISGREEGKTDDEISSELGSPAFLAKSLLEEPEGKQEENKRISNQGRRLCAYLIDALIAVLPSAIITGVLGAAVLSFMLLALYPAPLVGVTIYSNYSIPHPDTEIITNIDGEAENIRQDSGIPSAASIAFAVFGIVFYVIYSLIAALIFKGQTIGKKLMHIRVCRSNMAPITKGNILSRELIGKILINSIPIVPIISIFTIAFTKEHKAIHDMLADTIVIDI